MATSPVVMSAKNALLTSPHPITADMFKRLHLWQQFKKDYKFRAKPGNEIKVVDALLRRKYFTALKKETRKRRLENLEKRKECLRRERQLREQIEDLNRKLKLFQDSDDEDEK